MTINIRDIQHYMYCPRRFALMRINEDWAENVFVVRANIMHENVHSGRHNVKSTSKIEKSSVAIYNDELDIYGVADCVEFEKSEKGTAVEKLGGNYIVRLVEYKPTQPRDGAIRETDAIQVFAQKLCADYVWHCRSEGWLYYSDTRKRVRLPFEEEYDRYYGLLTGLLGEMRACIDSGLIPPKRSGQQCGGCSIENLCIPKTAKYDVKSFALKDDGVCENF